MTIYQRIGLLMFLMGLLMLHEPPPTLPSWAGLVACIFGGIVFIPNDRDER